MKIRLTGYLFIALLVCLESCKLKGNEENPIAHPDLPQIQERGELIVLTLNSAISYFDYRGEPMGFQYELAQQFAQSLGVELKVETAKDEAELVRMLLDGKGDLIAYNLAVTNFRKDSLLYCGEENITHQVIVQRKSREALKDVTELVGKEIYVNQRGKYHQRLLNLDKELGGGIQITEVGSDSVSVEDLITWVAEGKINYTAATDEIAKINRTYYPNLDISLIISFDQRSSWAVRKTSPLLAEAADTWHRANINSAAFKASAKRYFELNKFTVHSPFLSLKDGKISHFDDLFKKYAKEIGWDWRMLASLAYTESNFDPTVVSWAGARGLMQLMPATARKLGVPEGMEQDPEESVKAATKYIASLQKIFSKIEDPEERTKFVLAAYNAGVGHVTDAMALAEKYGKERYIWDHNVANYMLLKSNEEYYQDPVCKNGYFRGNETYNFVIEVTQRAKMYQEKLKG